MSPIQEGIGPLSILLARPLFIISTNCKYIDDILMDSQQKKYYDELDLLELKKFFTYNLLRYSFFIERGIPPVKLLKLKSLQQNHQSILVFQKKKIKN
jgi:hypothetical protein